MIVQKKKAYLKRSLDLVSYSEIVKYSDKSDPKKLIDFVFFSCNARKIDEKVFCFVFRQIKPFLNGLLDFSPNTKNLDFNILRALSRLIQSSSFDFEVFLTYITENNIAHAFENLRTMNERVKDASKLLIECIYRKFRGSSPILRDIIANELLVFHASQENSREVEFIFGLLRSMVISNELGDGMEEYYEQFVLPSISMVPCTACDSVYMVIEAFCSHSTRCKSLSLRFFAKSFQKLDSIDHVKLMEATTRILHVWFFKESSTLLEEDFSELLSQGLRSESYLVIDAVMSMISDHAVRRFMEVNIKSILPRVFEGLYKLSKRFWRLEQRCRAIQAIGSIFGMDGSVFEDCLIEYNRARYHRRCSSSGLDNEKMFNERIRRMQTSFDE